MMELFLIIVFCALLAGILLQSVIGYYSSSRAAKIRTLMIAAFVCIPLLALAVYVFAAGKFDNATRMWAVGIGALVLGFWLKRPFQDLAQG
jgi:hypothetical protein